MKSIDFIYSFSFARFLLLRGSPLLRNLALILLMAASLGTPLKSAAAQEPPVVEFSQAQLDAMLAPIALYPDTVLSHLLIASTYPLEVVEADRWVRSHTNLEGEAAVNAVDNKDWDPSVKALTAFPDILRRMSEDLDWTQNLGDAFLSNEARVMDSIQNLRNRAYASGNLDKVDNVRVIREEKTIIIEPSVERVVYVPAYDTRVIYGNWWWPDYPPVYWNYPSSYVFVSGFYWGPRVYLGPNFYFSSCHWRDRRVVVVDRHHHYSGPRFYDGRSISRYEDARPWQHNPVHRRNVAYHNERTRALYNGRQESYDSAHRYRDSLRGNNGGSGNGYVAPNRARELRQSNARTEQPYDRRAERSNGQQAGGARLPNLDKSNNPRNERVVRGNSNNVVKQQNDAGNQVIQNRAEQLRERMGAHNETQTANRQNIQRNERQLPGIKSDSHQPERAAIPGRSTTTTDAPRFNNRRDTIQNTRPQNGPEQRNNQSTNPVGIRAEHTTETRNYGNSRPQQQESRTVTPITRTETYKADRPQRIERNTEERINYNRDDNSNNNSDNNPRNNNTRDNNRIENMRNNDRGNASGGGERRIMRGGREM